MFRNNYSIYYNVMPDGTVKQINPFTGTEVWAVPGRGDKPISNYEHHLANKIQKTDPEAYCSFCRSRYFEVPPEKARLVRNNDRCETIYRLPPDQ